MPIILKGSLKLCATYETLPKPSSFGRVGAVFYECLLKYFFLMVFLFNLNIFQFSRNLKPIKREIRVNLLFIHWSPKFVIFGDGIEKSDPEIYGVQWQERLRFWVKDI